MRRPVPTFFLFFFKSDINGFKFNIEAYVKMNAINKKLDLINQMNREVSDKGLCDPLVRIFLHLKWDYKVSFSKCEECWREDNYLCVKKTF